MRNKFLAISVLASVIGVTSCKKNRSSGTKDQATTSSVKSGMFLPFMADAPNSNPRGQAPSKRSASELATALGWKLEAGKAGTFLKTSWGDEEILLIDHKDGTAPSPIASLKSGVNYRWDSVGAVSGRVVTTTPTFFRYKSGISNPELNVENIFVARQALTQSGVREPVIVPWLRHVRSEAGDIMLWRMGNSILDAGSGMPVLKFVNVGENIWRLSGPYKDGDLHDGSLFWTTDKRAIYSVTPKSSQVVVWAYQDEDSMDRVRSVGMNEISIPNEVKDLLQAENARKSPPTVQLGFDLGLSDPGIIRINDPRSTSSGAITQVKSSGGFSLDGGGGGRPAGLPNGYDNPQSLGVHQQVKQVSTGWWPFTNDEKDVSIQKEYFKVNRLDPISGKPTTKVVSKGADGQWEEQSATGFRCQIEQMENNATKERQDALQKQGSAIASEAARRRENIDADAKKFVDKGFTGHMTDVAVAAGTGALGPAVKLQNLGAAGNTVVAFSTSIGAQSVKNLPALANQTTSTKTLISSGIGVATDTIKQGIPGLSDGSKAGISSIGSVIKIGNEVASGDIDGAGREVQIGTVGVMADVVKSTVAVDPVTGAAFGAATQGAKIGVEGGALIVGLADTRDQFNDASAKTNEALQMSHDRDFASKAKAAFDTPETPVAPPAVKPASQEPALAK